MDRKLNLKNQKIKKREEYACIYSFELKSND